MGHTRILKNDYNFIVIFTMYTTNFIIIAVNIAIKYRHFFHFSSMSHSHYKYNNFYIDIFLSVTFISAQQSPQIQQKPHSPCPPPASRRIQKHAPKKSNPPREAPPRRGTKLRISMHHPAPKVLGSLSLAEQWRLEYNGPRVKRPQASSSRPSNCRRLVPEAG